MFKPNDLICPIRKKAAKNGYEKRGSVMRMRCLTSSVVALVAVVLAVYSASAGTVRYVSPSGTETNGYTNLAMAAKTIQKAVGISSNGDSVLVADATYLLTSSIPISAEITLQSINGYTNCIIDGGDTSNRIFVIATNVTIEGFTMTKCRQSDVDCPITGCGGAIYLSASGTVRSCYFVSNSVDRQHMSGGGVCLQNGGTIENSIFRNNIAYQGGGGGVYMANGGYLINCLIDGNMTYTWRSDGGGVRCSGGVLRNCLITGNSSAGDFYQDAKGGGGAHCINGSIVENCTIVFNTNTWDAAGGLILINSTSRNSIVYANFGTNCANYTNQNSAITFSCMTPLPSGTGNTTSDPAFVSGFRLASGSPCIDKGTNQAWMSGTLDLAGGSRICSG